MSNSGSHGQCLPDRGLIPRHVFPSLLNEVTETIPKWFRIEGRTHSQEITDCGYPLFHPKLLPKFLMDYCAGWGNRTNRDGTAQPVFNIHLWGEKNGS